MKRLFFVLCAAIAIAASARGKVADANKPDVFNERKWLEGMLEFNHRTLTQAYKDAGHRDPKWDAQAIKFLDGMSLRFANAGSDFAHLETPPKLDELEKLVREVRGAGCDDPLIADLFTVVLLDGGKADESRPMLRATVEQLLQSHYPVFRAGAAARRAANIVSQKTSPEDYAWFEQTVYDTDLAVMKFADLPGIDRRILLTFIMPDVESWPLEKRAKFVADLRAADADAWLTDMIEGRYHIGNGWAARGGGWANTVSDEGWKKLHEELVKARKCSEDAYRLQPTFPEAATQMLSVIMGDQCAPGETIRTWFDRAIAAQIDFDPAYESYDQMLLPRWYGSHESMFELGIECANVPRYDTGVPFHFITELDNICEDSEGDWSYWRRPGVIERVSDIINHYVDDNAKDDYGRQWYQSQLVGYAWQVGRYDLAKTALDKIGGKTIEAAINRARVIPVRAVSCVYAMSGTNAPAIKSAETLAAAGKLDDAIKQYRDLTARVGADDPQAAWMNGRPQELQWQEDFNGGEWINLIPKSERLDGWYAQGYGKFSTDGKTISFQSDGGDGFLICGAKFGQRWEYRISVTIDPDTSGKIPQFSDGGMVVNWAGPVHHVALTARPGETKVGWKWDCQSISTLPFDGIGPATTFHIRYWDGRGEVSVNDRVWIPFTEFRPGSTRPDNRIGLASIYAGATKLRITRCEIRKLEKNPENADVPPAH